MRNFMLFIILALAACERDETLAAYGGAGDWRLSALDGAVYSATATMRIGDGGEVSGRAACNAWGASQTAPYPWFELTPIVATKRACADLGAEAAFFQALGEMTLAEVLGDTLLLTNEAGRSMEFISVAPDD
ncbi:META domain-containing protein [Primorskyibacter sedentarius]|uniref:META domain-containing protein n=1 Tax=Primorskyibacter sedentarius TaxID=745311 RepID=UPI003EBFCFF4